MHYVRFLPYSASQSPPPLPPPPLLGSFILYETLLDARCCRVLDGLTEEAAAARLSLGGFAPPLYVHAALPDPAAARLRDLAARTHVPAAALRGTLAAPLDPAPGSFLEAIAPCVAAPRRRSAPQLPR